MLRPFASLETRPITRRREPFAIRRAELELHRKPAFGERRMCFEREAFLELTWTSGVSATQLTLIVPPLGHGMERA